MKYPTLVYFTSVRYTGGMSYITIDMHREHATYTVGLPGTDRLKLVSQPTWDGCITAISELVDRPDDIVVTPELITSAGDDAIGTDSRMALIAERIAEVQTLSERKPNLTILLGSLMTREATGDTLNTVQFIKEGTTVGYTAKTTIINQHEAAFITPARNRSDIQAVASHIQPIICADIFRPPTIDPWIDTLTVSALYGTPAGYDVPTVTDEATRERFLKMTIQDLFTAHTQLRTIAMVDRAPTPDTQPFNVIAQRGLY